MKPFDWFRMIVCSYLLGTVFYMVIGPPWSVVLAVPSGFALGWYMYSDAVKSKESDLVSFDYYEIMRRAGEGD